MTLVELLRDHIARGEFIGGHHLRLRDHDLRVFMEREGGERVTGSPNPYIGPSLLFGLSVVADESVPEGQWRLCPNSAPQQVVTTGAV